MPLTIAQALRWPDLERVDARVLLQHALGVNHAYLIAHGERALTQEEAERVQSLFLRRGRGEPVAYLTGRREFFGREFRVSPAVLIPRPETELLVELALGKLAARDRPRVLDLGTGSGCIALTLALERPDAHVTAVDASVEALALARLNAADWRVRNAALVEGDWFDAVRGRTFDLIVANPPYVAQDDPHLRMGDVRFEPRVALAAGPAGLDALALIAAGVHRHLVPGGWVLLEHGWDQAQAVTTLLSAADLSDVVSTRDLAGQPRVSAGRRPPAAEAGPLPC